MERESNQRMPIMSQVILPPAEPEPQPEAPAPSIATALIPQPPEPERPKYVYEYVPPPQPRAWRAVKWPLRQLFKGLYLTGSAAKRHKIVTLVILALLIGGVGATYGVYRATHPATATSAAGGGTTLPPGAQQPETPFTIVNSAAPPLSPSVIQWLHAWKTHDGKEAWNALSPTTQSGFEAQGVDEKAIQQRLDQDRVQGIEYDQFIYSGGYFYPDGSSNYTVEVIQRMPTGGHTVLTWIFVVDPGGGIVVAGSLNQ
jgi:hypothetical protein